MPRFVRALFALSLLATSGCYKVTHTTGASPTGAPITQKASFFLFGLIGEADVDLKQLCPSGVAWFQNRAEVGDSIIGCVTCGLYQPMTIEVRCSSGKAFLAVPDAEQNVTWVYDLPSSPEGSL